MKWILFFVLICNLLGSAVISTYGHSFEQITILYKVGSRGEKVNELQERLKFLGYFPQKVKTTMFFGAVTQKAVQWFQSQFNLPRKDGIVDVKTWEMLIRATKRYMPHIEKNEEARVKEKDEKVKEENERVKEKDVDEKSNIPITNSGFTDNEIKMLEKIAYAEARGEGYEGMVAVVSVILNRVKTTGFPNTIAGVIFAPHAFEPVKNGHYYGARPNLETKKAVTAAINGMDPTNGCAYFFNPAGVKNPWVWRNLRVSKRIGNHIFCKKR